MKIRLFVIGLAIWAVATIALRLVGQRLLHSGHSLDLLILFGLSFLVVATLVRRLCTRSKLPASDWTAGAIAILLPTLLLDPFSSAFFTRVFPNMAPELAGVFGGWMLISCAGGLVGAMIGPRGRS